MIFLCRINELGLSCFGCCGNNYSNKKKLIKDIKHNTKELGNLKSMRSFMARFKGLRPSGICANLVFKDGAFYCPGHPLLHQGRDYRDLDPDCSKDFVCKTYRLFQLWDEKKQQKFLDFLKAKNFDSFAYSIKMENNSILEEFEKNDMNSGERI